LGYFLGCHQALPKFRGRFSLCVGFHLTDSFANVIARGQLAAFSVRNYRAVSTTVPDCPFSSLGLLGCSHGPQWRGI
jgi:hypothetical protein